MPAVRWALRIKKTYRYAERNAEARIYYLRRLRAIVAQRGAQSLVYLDESGFAASTHRPYGWGPKGRKVYGERSGDACPRTSLIAAKHGDKLLAPVLFSGSTNAQWFNRWLKDHLFKELPEHATIIMDDATFHKTPETKRIIAESPFQALCLPPYSPDFNPIEKVFAILKKRRQYAPPDTTLDQLVTSYESYSV